MKQLTDEQLCNAYISYRHDFGLMSKEDKDCLVFEAREWARAFNLTGEAQPAADPLHPEFIAGFKAGRYAGLRKLESMPEDAVNPELGGVQCPKCSTQFTAFLVSQPAADDKAGGDVARDGYLCQAWGETDTPCAEVVWDLDGVRKFMVREWIGDENDPAAASVTEEIASHNFKDEGDWHAEFEIGGASVKQVYSYTRPQPQAEAPDTGLLDAAKNALAALEYHTAQTRSIFVTEEAITKLRAAIAKESNT